MWLNTTITSSRLVCHVTCAVNTLKNTRKQVHQRLSPFTVCASNQKRRSGRSSKENERLSEKCAWFQNVCRWRTTYTNTFSSVTQTYIRIKASTRGKHKIISALPWELENISLSVGCFFLSNFVWWIPPNPNRIRP